MLTTLDIVHSAGLDVRRKGSRWWMYCPLHSEKTPSFCIFPDDRWYCFGCHAYGDAADLYAALYGTSLGEALRVVRGEQWKQRPRKPTANDLRRVVEAWKGARWREACEQLHTAQAIINKLEGTQPDNERFWEAVADAATANDILNLLAEATPRQLLSMMEGKK